MLVYNRFYNLLICLFYSVLELVLPLHFLNRKPVSKFCGNNFSLNICYLNLFYFCLPQCNFVFSPCFWIPTHPVQLRPQCIWISRIFQTAGNKVIRSQVKFGIYIRESSRLQIIWIETTLCLGWLSQCRCNKSIIWPTSARLMPKSGFFFLIWHIFIWNFINTFYLLIYITGLLIVAL